MWQQKRGLPALSSIPVLYGDVIYSVRDGTMISALDLNTGEVLKEARAGDAPGDHFASPAGIAGKLYVANADGQVAVNKAETGWVGLKVSDLAEVKRCARAV